jgi:transposase
MLGKKKYEAKLMYNINLEEMVPDDNTYKLMCNFLDLRFLYKECEKFYGKTGKPSIDPVVFFKYQIYGYFENITGDRDLVRKASDSFAARYFLGYDIDEKLPWHSTISRTRGLLGKEVFASLFDRVLELCYASGLVEGKHQTIDSTLVKANASLDNVERKVPKFTAAEFVNKTYEENQENDNEENVKDELNNETEEKDSNKNAKKTDKSEKRNDLYESKTDKDSRIASKPRTISDLYYKTHYSADVSSRVITDVYVTFADIDDRHSLIDVIDRAEERLGNFNLTIEKVSADRGYSLGSAFRELEERGIEAFIPSSEKVNTTGGIDKSEFTYNKEEDIFICPNQKVLKYCSYDKQKESNRYRANQKDCAACPLKKKCSPEGKFRSIRQSIYYEEYDRANQRMNTPEGRKAYVSRKTISEGLFAEAKGNHGLKKYMSRGIDKVQKVSYMIAMVQNLKRLVRNLRKKSATLLNKPVENLVINFFNNNFSIKYCN